MWRFFEVGGRHIISLLVTTLLARMIMPQQYGLVAMITVFISISEVFIDAGFSTALIRDNDRTPADCSTVFYFNMVVSVLFCVALQFCAPLIADFYDMPELTTITRVVSLTLIISGFSSVQRSLLEANLNFKRITTINLAALCISGVVGIVMAYMNCQVWALVAQMLLARLIATLVMWIKSDWHPMLTFSRSSFHRYFKFGSSLLGSALLNSIYGNSYSLIIGKMFSSANLAFYNRAGNFANTASAVPTGIVESVTFPALCKLQEDIGRLRDGYRRLIRLSAFVVFPLCLGLGAVAHPFITVLLTSRWEYAAVLMQIMVFSYMWYPIHSLNLNLLKVCGKSGLFFRLEICKKIVGVSILCITVPIGLKAMCYGSIASSMIALIINTHYTGKLIGMGIMSQIRDIFPTILLTLAMFAITSLTAHWLGNDWVSLFCSIAVGIATYTVGALLFRFPEVRELKNLRK